MRSARTIFFDVFRFLLLPFFLFAAGPLSAQIIVSDSSQNNTKPPQQDSVFFQKDSIAQLADTTGTLLFSEDLFQSNKYLRELPPPMVSNILKRNFKGKELLFYIIAFLALLLGVFRITFSTYFNNLFRVLFNTSFRQSQLTDQLLQAKWSSLLFNLFFFCSAGFYLYLLLGYLSKVDCLKDWYILSYCIFILMLVYVTKFLWLKFMGWVTGMGRSVNDYLFVVFLVNKIMGICLFPLLPIMAFSDIAILQAAIPVSVIIISVLLGMRFFKSYSLISSRFKVSRFHFLLYIIALEVIPLIILYKSTLFILEKKL